jgi:hypothetical protein
LEERQFSHPSPALRYSKMSRRKVSSIPEPMSFALPIQYNARLFDYFYMYSSFCFSTEPANSLEETFSWRILWMAIYWFVRIHGIYSNICISQLTFIFADREVIVPLMLTNYPHIEVKNITFQYKPLYPWLDSQHIVYVL